MWKWLAGVLGLVCGSVYLANASWAWGERGAPFLLAHRGVAQQFSREGLANDTCTAARTLAPTHGYIENTLPSIGAAFDYGADIVEIDVHPTTDGEFAVFHDWTLDCRTNGQGVTREQSMAYLRTLDVGYGYTADGGQTFPFRGQFVGAMPTLNEVLDAFPQRRFLINIKSNDAAEADLLVAYMGARDISRLSFLGGPGPIERLRTLRPEARMLSRQSLRRCMLHYLATGWAGQVPGACHNSIVFVPINYRALLWGWPNLLVERMAAVNTEVVIVGPLQGNSLAGSIDDPADVRSFAPSYAGGISTDRIEVIGPTLMQGEQRQ